MHSIIEKHYRHNFSSLVKRVRYRTNGNDHDAEDIVQEAYCRALKYQHSFEMGMNFGHWLSRIVANSFKDWKREQYNGTLTDEFDEDEVEPIEERHTQNNLIARIQEEIGYLIPEHQEIVRLNLESGSTPREITQITNIKLNTVKQVLSRFKQKIREQYA